MDKNKDFLINVFRKDQMRSRAIFFFRPNVCFSRTEDTEKADSEKEIAVHVRYQTQVCDGSDTVHKCTTT